MLFNSHVFIFLFLPMVLLGYHGLKKISASHHLPLIWLLMTSLFFYGWWDARYLLLLLTSITINFILGNIVYHSGKKRIWLAIGKSFNLLLIIYFKYANFVVNNVSWAFGETWEFHNIILPLAISFFTFQQIAWLVDIYKNKTVIPSFYNYALFVSFFPQLIAGPIVHHSEMMPQFERPLVSKQAQFNMGIGLTLFTLGLFKKVVLADQFALYATPVFEAAWRGEVITFLEAWVGTLSYTFQLYFDFSGYSDMAVGLARMLGIVLPINFFSPYKAHNIRQFWQRWHITLSRFLRDYLYIPLGGNRARAVRVSVNIMLTMLIGGLWHGASWTFVAWGGLHGFYLIIHRLYETRHSLQPGGFISRPFIGVSVTFMAVILAWVLFRADSFTSAVIIYKGLFGFSGLSLPIGLFDLSPALKAGTDAAGFTVAQLPYFKGFPELLWLLAGSLICFVAPNVYQFLADQDPALIPPSIKLQQSRIRWRDNFCWAFVFAFLLMWSVLKLNRISEFLYFQF